MSGRYIRQNPYVDDFGIYVPDSEYVPEGCESIYRCIITKEMFVEAYNKWINNGGMYRTYGEDNADDWSED